uniref:Uncharacterized protein n=1 Tax=Arundo donax TaxID=35708 RepID=A0A0A8Y099_ARUDO
MIPAEYSVLRKYIFFLEEKMHIHRKKHKDPLVVQQYSVAVACF